ncbi:type II toxin-antitoxin system HicA family toxin [Candidatus Peregrinibacteria bacterium]|nr:type II toxin-antitoxin system HicA family toxin [Candidatus Peregrinibacteria bacterium]
MSGLTPISARKLMKILLSLGFEEVRRKGSHCFFFNNMTGLSTVVPDHGSEDIGRGLLRKILRDIDLAPIEFEKMR